MKNKLDLELVINAIGLTVMLGIVFLNVLSRYIFHLSLASLEEIVCVLFVVISLVGAAAAEKSGGHLTLDLLTGSLKPRTKSLVYAIGSLLTLIAALVLAVTGALMVHQQYSMGAVSFSLLVPAWIYGLTIPLGCLLLAFRSGQNVIKYWKAYRADEDGAAS